jgi:hypothetical protein
MCAQMVGAADVPYYLLVVLLVLYSALGRPLQSSFASPARMGLGGGAAKAAAVGAKLAKGSTGAASGGYHYLSPALLASSVQSKADSAMMALVVGLAPAALYVGVHWSALLMRASMHGYAVALLAGAPWLAMALMPRGMWWLPGSVGMQSFVRRTVLVVSLFATLVGFEGRVLFYAFGQYIKLHPPWGGVAVTVALFGSAAIALAYAGGLLGGTVDITVAGA